MTHENILNLSIEDRIEIIRNCMKQIELNKITILTGSNGSGKSLIRQQLAFKLAKDLNCSPRGLTIDVSMAKRTSSNPDLGALASFMADDPTEPTSLATFYHIQTTFNSIGPEHDWYPYIILDEPEIGMSRESQLGLASYLKEDKDTILHNSKGMCIITHSEFLVKELESISTFLNMDGYETADEWINRTIIPTDFHVLQDKSSELFHHFIKNKHHA